MRMCSIGKALSNPQDSALTICPDTFIHIDSYGKTVHSTCGPTLHTAEADIHLPD